MKTGVVPSVVVVALVAICVFSGSVVQGIEHNLPDGVELVDPKDLGLDSQIDHDKLLGNVKALPIDGNALSSALGKPGLKTQVLTVGFDGSEGINLDDFELPHLKNDEHAPLAQAAFSSFKNFFKNSSSASTVGEGSPEEPIKVTTHRPGGKRKTMMKRRKIARTNNGTKTTTSTTTPQPASLGAAGPKVIELDASQIDKLIASGKIRPPKSLTPGGPQIIELGQGDLDALLNSENGDEIKQILEGGDTVKDFDLSQLSSSSVGTSPTTTTRVTESDRPVTQQLFQTSPLPQQELVEVVSTPPPQQELQQQTIPTTQAAPPSPPPLILPILSSSSSNLNSNKDFQ